MGGPLELTCKFESRMLSVGSVFMGDDERPPFGYGVHGRGLWSVRDRDAEVIRSLLRREGYREFRR